MVDLWYGALTPDEEFPAAARELVLGMLGRISARSHGLNLAALLIRDTTEIFTEQLELYRRVVARRGCGRPRRVRAGAPPPPLRPDAPRPPTRPRLCAASSATRCTA